MSQAGALQPKVSTWRLLVKRILAAVGLIFVIDTAMFLIAGRLDWMGAWVFSLLYLVFLLTFVVWGTFWAPELLKERSRMEKNVKTWDKVIMGIYTILFIAMFVVPALDVGRLRWSSVPLAVQLIGIVGLFPAGGVVWWVMRTNAYASRYVRIQDDRSQQVVTTGPYQYVRHPQYAALLLFFWCIPLTLESWWGLVPGVLTAVLFSVRTALEDRTLRAELPSYAEYAQRVRYRLIPGVW